MAQYKVRGSTALVRHDNKDYFEGDVLELSTEAAFANRHLLEPLGENKEFQQLLDAQSTDLALRRSALDARRADLQKQVDDINRELSHMDSKERQEKSEQDARQKSRKDFPVMSEEIHESGVPVKQPSDSPVFPAPPGGEQAQGAVGVQQEASQGTTERTSK